MCALESTDMWIKIKLFMAQGKYNIDSEMDLKINKAMVLKDFKNLMQKLALQMWNRCVKVFEQQRKKAIAKSSIVFKSMLSDNNEVLKDLTMIELEQIQRVFILKAIQILTASEYNRRDSSKQSKKDAVASFDIKPASPIQRRATV